MTELQRKIFEEIVREREYQDKHWGEEFDSKNTLNDWVTYINRYASRAADENATVTDTRTNLIKVAALVVAACEAFDSNNGFPPRHYE